MRRRGAPRALKIGALFRKGEFVDGHVGLDCRALGSRFGRILRSLHGLVQHVFFGIVVQHQVTAWLLLLLLGSCTIVIVALVQHHGITAATRRQGDGRGRVERGGARLDGGGNDRRRSLGVVVAILVAFVIVIGCVRV